MKSDFTYQQAAQTDGFSSGNYVGLDDKRIRRIFVRKVFLILLVLLSFTFGCVAMSYFTPGLKTFVRQNPALYYVSFVLFFASYITLACCKSVARRPGINYAILAILNLSMTYMVSMITAFHNTQNVLLAMGITVLVCLSVILFSMQTKYDFTKCTGTLFVASIAFMAFAVFMIAFPTRIMVMLYGGIGAILFSIFLALDIQLIMGGKRYEISEEDYVFAAIMLYLDIVYIFLYILQLLGVSRD
ncbi:hypothetical protein ACOME3_005722 [Neoechinorhynchus agilis]